MREIPIRIDDHRGQKMVIRRQIRSNMALSKPSA